MFGHVARDVLLAIKGQFSSGAKSMSAFVIQFHSYRRAVVVVGPANTAVVDDSPRTDNRCQSAITGQLFHGHCDVRVSALQRVQRCSPQSLIRVGLLNARSVSNKCANIQHWISDRKLNVAALVETWHDDASSPDLIACAPSGFQIVEKARVRRNELSTSTNHGGVCLLYDASLHGRPSYRPARVFVV